MGSTKVNSGRKKNAGLLVFFKRRPSEMAHGLRRRRRSPLSLSPHAA